MMKETRDPPVADQGQAIPGVPTGWNPVKAHQVRDPVLREIRALHVEPFAMHSGGAQSEVYLGKDSPEAVAPVVVKVVTIPQDDASSSGAAHICEREFDILGRLEKLSPHVPHREAFGHHAMTMEYVSGIQGPDLHAAVVSTAVDVRNVYDALQAVTAEALSRIAAILSRIHAQRIVHKDIKLANVAVRPSGDVVIFDFGVSCRLFNEQDVAECATGGTLQNMPPENLHEHRETGASDLYALGCALVKLLTNKPLFDGQTPNSVLRQKVERVAHDTRVQSILHLEVRFARLRDLLSRMLSYDSADRPSMDEVMDLSRKISEDLGGIEAFMRAVSADALRRQRHSAMQADNGSATFIQDGMNGPQG